MANKNFLLIIAVISFFFIIVVIHFVNHLVSQEVGVSSSTIKQPAIAEVPAEEKQKTALPAKDTNMSSESSNAAKPSSSSAESSPKSQKVIQEMPLDSVILVQ